MGPDAMRPPFNDFQRYLAAKQPIDDRALHFGVWQALQHAWAITPGPRHVLEVGAGIGTMLERLLAHDFLRRGDAYTAVDADPANAAVFAAHWSAEAPVAGWQASRAPDGRWLLKRGDSSVEARFVIGEAATYAEAHPAGCQLLLAHAFLDLIDLPRHLPVLLRAIAPGGLFYFTLNFDGETVFEPVDDPVLEGRLLAAYHRTMDERTFDGHPSGDSRAGRHLFSLLQQEGATLLEAGASDWVVFPRSGAYPGEEAYFLHVIVEMVSGAVAASGEVEAPALQAWTAQRHAQIERGELVYLAHQLDFVGRR
jgi:SAM-dependent methyltransferase